VKAERGDHKEDLPVGFPSTVFLGFLRVSVNVARLGEVARKMLVSVGSAVSEAVVVSVVVFVGAGH